MTHGAVAAGSPRVVDAGLRALRLGGGAVDAVIAATLVSCVVEPLLGGLGGAGLAMVRLGGQARCLDFFTAMPGLGTDAAPPMDEIVVDFGVTRQTFHAGPGAVAVPGLPAGLAALHAAGGTLPLDVLAEPAIAAAQEGFEVTPVLATVASLLTPILGRDPAVAAAFAPTGRPVRAGERFRWPQMGEGIAAFARSGGALWTGPVGARVLEVLGPRSRLNAEDLGRYRATWATPLQVAFRDAVITLPGPPSVAGLLVCRALRALEPTAAEAPGTAAEVTRLARAWAEAEAGRADVTERLFAPDFVARALAETRNAGFTTHISAIDGRGDAVSLTHSLGETAGVAVPELGLLLNSFLGESDVNPPAHPRPPGGRLYTMCCPTLVERGDRVTVLGTGGSSRIRSAILQGVVNQVDHGLDPGPSVMAPRAHLEQGVLHVEAPGRPAGAVSTLRDQHPDLVVFEAPHLFFGGLHTVASDGDRFLGAGDARRDGAWGRV